MIETEVKNEVVKLDSILPEGLLAFENKKSEVALLIQENPFIEVTKETEKIARKRRTNLLKGRTSIQGDVKLIKGKLNEIKAGVDTMADELIAQILPIETRQQEAIDEYDAALEAEREAKKKAEADRIAAITKHIASLKESYLERLIKAKTIGDIQLIETDIRFLVLDPEFFNEYMFDAEQAKNYIIEKIAYKAAEIREAERIRIQNVSEEYTTLFGLNPAPGMTIAEIESAISYKKDEIQKSIDAERKKQAELQAELKKRDEELKARLAEIEERERKQKEVDEAAEKIRIEKQKELNSARVEFLKLFQQAAPETMQIDEILSACALKRKELNDFAQKREAERLEALKPIKERMKSVISINEPEFDKSSFEEDHLKVLCGFFIELENLKKKYVGIIDSL